MFFGLPCDHIPRGFSTTIMYAFFGYTIPATKPIPPEVIYFNMPPSGNMHKSSTSLCGTMSFLLSLSPFGNKYGMLFLSFTVCLVCLMNLPF
jgi:hypothetical protein